MATLCVLREQTLNGKSGQGDVIIVMLQLVAEALEHYWLIIKTPGPGEQQQKAIRACWRIAEYLY